MALSDKDQKAFEELIRRRQSSKRRVETPKRAKKEFSHEEYLARLKEENDRTQAMVQDQSGKRVQLSLERWSDIVGPRFFGAGLEVEEPKILERIENFKNNTGEYNSSVVLTGGLGVGKTWRAYGYAEKLIREDILLQQNIVSGTEISVLGSIATSGFRKADKMTELLDERHKFFLIDEVGRTKFPNVEAQQEIWYELINHIYMNNLTLVISTNKSTNEFKQKINIEPPTFRNAAEMRAWQTHKESEDDYISTNELEQWIGKAAYDRLKHIVGDGIIVPKGANKRPGLLAQKKNGTR